MSMNFQSIPPVEKPQAFLDTAFNTAAQRTQQIRSKKFKDRATKARQLELIRVETATKLLSRQLLRILKSFPSFEQLPQFYKELSRTTLDVPEVRRALGSLNWANENVQRLSSACLKKMRKSRDSRSLRTARTEFYGRCASIIKQIGTPLALLEETRKTMKGFPTIKTETKTIAIVGFPNVGKTTLLFNLTGSRPEIHSYPFTTKTINVAYLQTPNGKIQLLDTPGTLNRFDKMNSIEKQAHLAMKLVADLLVCVIDLTEPYPLEKQLKLYESLQPLGKPMLLFLSKTDIMDTHQVQEFSKRHSVVATLQELKETIASIISASIYPDPEKTYKHK